MPFAYIGTLNCRDVFQCQNCRVVVAGPPDECPVCYVGRFEDCDTPFAPAREGE